jgi:undecaprenyl pyrophosphate phosphatase UppP
MNLLNNIPVRLSVFSSIYVIVLIFFAPFIDHLFTSLEEDKAIEENNFHILLEILIHIIVLSVSWYFLHKYLRRALETLLGVKIKDATKQAIDFISAIALVGLQRNLIDKLEYITYKHPFRINDLYE